MAATALLRPLCTLDDVKREAKIPLTDSESNEKLRNAINSASRYIESYLRREFVSLDYSTTALKVRNEWVYGGEVFLPWPLLTSPSEVAIDGTILIEDEDYLTNFDDPESPVTGRLRYIGKWPELVVERLVTVKGTFGWAQTGTTATTGVKTSGDGVPAGVPGAVSYAAAQLAARWSGEYRREMLSGEGQRTQSVVDGRMPHDLAMMLDRFRRANP